MSLHEAQTVNHRLERWVYADAATRIAATGFVAGDIGKVAYQTDTADYYRLTATTPTWSFIGSPDDGWIPQNTWTYASATTFTISGDLTAIYSKGDRLKLTQTTVKYFYIVAISYSAPNTTVTVTGGIDYTLANAAITANYFSKSTSPNGFPTYFNYTPTWTGFSANPTGGSYYFFIVGSICFYTFRPGAAGTSNTTTLKISLPVTSVGDAHVAARISDAGIGAFGSANIDSGDFTNIVFFSTATGSAFTASGLKQGKGQINYPF